MFKRGREGRGRGREATNGGLGEHRERQRGDVSTVCPFSRNGGPGGGPSIRHPPSLNCTALQVHITYTLSLGLFVPHPLGHDHRTWSNLLEAPVPLVPTSGDSEGVSLSSDFPHLTASDPKLACPDMASTSGSSGLSHRRSGAGVERESLGDCQDDGECWVVLSSFVETDSILQLSGIDP